MSNFGVVTGGGKGYKVTPWEIVVLLGMVFCAGWLTRNEK